MKRPARRDGQIVTFFSYKGGVGRTMAVANLGFIAATGGLKVLLIDCDLEAPGLPVYFRGLTDQITSAELRKSKGVLDLFVEWQEQMSSARSRSGVDDILRRYRTGKAFQECARALVSADRLPKGAALDLIGAGSPTPGGDDLLSYADVLSRFSWSSFFEDVAGGVMLQALRNWAKKKYDLILIDSRTGLADVAGICTMQLPDTVVLCFVLNRQNTEGIAQVAESIRNARGEEVQIRVSPMRVSKDRPTEEADARARAQRELRRAGLDPEAVEHDMSLLAISVASNVPFYETLAPFAATSASADPLTFEYLRMAQGITDHALSAPQVDPRWVEEVRRRLQPRMTTIEYLASLETADPERAIEEVERFLDGALDADPSRELDPEYVSALVKAGLESHEWAWDEEQERGAMTLGRKAVTLLEQLHAVGEGDWRLPLVEAMEEFEIRWGLLEGDAVQQSNTRKDAILREGEQTAEILIRRARLRVSNARTIGISKETLKRATRQLYEADELLQTVSGAASRTNPQFLMTEASIAEMRSTALILQRRKNDALTQLALIIERLAPVENPVANRLKAEAYFKRAELLVSDIAAAAEDVIKAARTSRAVITRDLDRLVRATDIVLESGDAKASVTFVIAVFGTAEKIRVAIRARTTQDARKFAGVAEKLALTIGASADPRRADALGAIADAADLIFSRSVRLAPGRFRSNEEGERVDKVVRLYAALVELLASLGCPERRLARLRNRLFRTSTGGEGVSP